MNLRFEQPFEGGQTTASSPITGRDPISSKWTLKEGAGSPILFADRIAVTPAVLAGGVVDAEVEIVNAATVISPFDADHCSDGGNAGFRYTITVNPSWTSSQSSTDCLNQTENRKTTAFDFDAPSESGVYSVEVVASMPGSGNSASETFEVAVNAQDSGGGDGGDDGGGELRPGPGDGITDSPGGIFPDVGNVTSGLAILVLILLLLLVVSFALP